MDTLSPWATENNTLKWENICVKNITISMELAMKLLMKIIMKYVMIK